MRSPATSRPSRRRKCSAAWAAGGMRSGRGEGRERPYLPRCFRAARPLAWAARDRRLARPAGRRRLWRTGARPGASIPRPCPGAPPRARGHGDSGASRSRRRACRWCRRDRGGPSDGRPTPVRRPAASGARSSSSRSAGSRSTSPRASEPGTDEARNTLRPRDGSRPGGFTSSAFRPCSFARRSSSRPISGSSPTGQRRRPGAFCSTSTQPSAWGAGQRRTLRARARGRCKWRSAGSCGVGFRTVEGAYLTNVEAESWEPFDLGDGRILGEVHWLRSEDDGTGSFLHSGVWRVNAAEPPEPFSYEMSMNETIHVLDGEVHIQVEGGDMLVIRGGRRVVPARSRHHLDYRAHALQGVLRPSSSEPSRILERGGERAHYSDAGSARRRRPRRRRARGRAPPGRARRSRAARCRPRAPRS